MEKPAGRVRQNQKLLRMHWCDRDSIRVGRQHRERMGRLYRKRARVVLERDKLQIQARAWM